MAIYKGSTKIGAIYKGSTKIGKIYKGSTLVYQSKRLVALCFKGDYSWSAGGQSGQRTIYVYIYINETNPITSNSILWTALDFNLANSTSELTARQDYKLTAYIAQDPSAYIYFTPGNIININGYNFNIESTLLHYSNILGFTQNTSNISFTRYTAGDLYV